MDTSDIDLAVHLRVWHTLGIKRVYLPLTGKFKSLSPTNKTPQPGLSQEKNTQRPKINPESENFQPIQEDFPMPWQKIWAKLSPPYPQVWTYWELPADLEANPDPTRRTLWRNILSALNWPAGTIAFWPMSTFCGGVLKQDLPNFWKGIPKINPQLIVCFGQAAFSKLFSERTFEYGYFTYNKQNILVLPGPGDMLPDNKAMKKCVWDYLSSIETKS